MSTDEAAEGGGGGSRAGSTLSSGSDVWSYIASRETNSSSPSPSPSSEAAEDRLKQLRSRLADHGYCLKEKIGSGGFGKVYRAVRRPKPSAATPTAAIPSATRGLIEVTDTSAVTGTATATPHRVSPKKKPGRKRGTIGLARPESVATVAANMTVLTEISANNVKQQTKASGRSRERAATRKKEDKDRKDVVVEDKEEEEEVVAIKVMKYSKRKSVNEDIEQEIRTLRVVEHPNIIRLLGIVRSTTRVCLVLEYCSAGNLRTIVDNSSASGLAESEVRQLMTECAYAIYYLHVNKIAHRDFKLENVLIDSEFRVKVIDFGYSYPLVYPTRPGTGRGGGGSGANGRMSAPVGDPNGSSAIVGTKSHYAPEILLKDLANDFESKCNPVKVDCWCFGIGLWYALMGSYPFNRRKPREMYASQMGRKWTGADELARKTSPELMDLMRRLLDPNPASRPTFDAIIGHRWFPQEGEEVAALRRSSNKSLRSSVSMGAAAATAAALISSAVSVHGNH